MRIRKSSSRKIKNKGQRAAVASPLRLEILGLFVCAEPLAISDMARLMNRSAGSLYHHVGILVEAGILKKTGTRPKGKRHEALYIPTASRFEFDTSSGEEETITSAVRTMAAGFRMAERDLEAALRSDSRPMQGPDPDFFAFRLHMRASPELLVEINEHMTAVIDLLRPDKNTSAEPGPDDQHVSLTLALLPIKGRDLRDS